MDPCVSGIRTLFYMKSVSNSIAQMAENCPMILATSEEMI